MSSPCRILDDNELEGLQWRKNAEELRVNNIFSSQKNSIFSSKLPFTQKSKKEIRYFNPGKVDVKPQAEPLAKPQADRVG